MNYKEEMDITKKLILEHVRQVLNEQPNPMSFVRRFIGKYADDVAIAAERGESITGALKRARGVTRAEKEMVDAIDAVVEHTRIHSRGGRQALPKDTDELLKAIAGQGVKLSDDQWRQLYTGFFKSENVPIAFLDDMAQDLVRNPRFISRYGKIKTEKDLINKLKAKGYSDNSVNAIINAVNEPENAGKFFGRAIEDAGGKPKPKPGEKPTPGTKPTPGGKGGPGALGRFFKGKKRLIIGGALVKLGLLGATAYGVYWLWNRFFKDVMPKDQAQENLAPLVERIKKFFAVRPCMADILDDDGVQLEIDPKGYTVIKVTNTGVPEYDQAGGLGFFDYGIVYKINEPKAIGTYNCKGKNLAEDYYNNLIEDVIFEQTQVAGYGDGNPNTGIGGISIKWQTDAQGNALQGASGASPNKVCNDKPLPHEKGCRSREISSVQACTSGLRITSVLDDATINKLTSLGYDMSQGLTREIYDAIMKKCGRPTSQRQATPTQKQQVQRPANNMPKMQSKQATVKPNNP